MKILVTGGAGFIGSHLVDALLARGDTVAVIDDFNEFYDPALKRANVEAWQTNPGFTLHELDVRDLRGVVEVVKTFAPDSICHLAARAGVRPSIEDPWLYEDVNSRGTLNMLEAARAAECANFVFASSSSVYGLNSKVPFSEDDPVTRPISPYAATKRAGELICHTYSHLYGLPMTCLRFFTVYGQRGRPDMAVAKFTRLIHDGRAIDVYGDGSAQRDFTYVSDIIEGVLAAIDTPRDYGIINIGGSKTDSVSTLIRLIEESLGRKAEINYMDTVPGDVPITYADVTRAGRLLGFSPEVTLARGVARYVSWFLEREAATRAV